ncbi:MFS transporter [Lactobacillus alimentarius DSM] [Lactiplantibacillus mudanjiangensis]|uniref:MFS transporter n=1 Tax=Lactiplantibacillus mudanjiangensis TaxID=1296538 RepID=UPI001013E985|nr:MFS transporter [Lactiplantibacillus mudanjiangensis]VDG33645.1 MFS transporter [Lactobacillus alimentarius DSM] [Lactiplantibacillus mudanjiangensis]
MRKLAMRLSILLLSIFTVSGGAIAATIPMMMKSFPNISPTLIELLMTVPSLGIIIFTPLSNFFADRFGVKNTILTGLVIILIAGITPALTTSFGLIFASRIGIGIGTGLLASFAQSLIIQLFDGAEQQRMMGLSSVFQGLGMFVITYFAGVLMNFSWQTAYWVYLVALPIALLVAFFVPKGVGQVEEPTTNVSTSNSKHVDGKVWVLAGFAFLFNVTFAFITIKFASLVVSRHYGTVMDASTLLGMMSFAMAAGGFLFMFIQKHWRAYSMAIALAFATAAFLILTMSQSLLLSGLGVIFVGIAVSVFMASMVTSVGYLTSAQQVPFSTSVAITCANVGTLVSPYIAQLFSQTSGNTTPAFTFLMGTFVFAILLILATLAGLNYGKLGYHAMIKGVAKNAK